MEENAKFLEEHYKLFEKLKEDLSTELLIDNKNILTKCQEIPHLYQKYLIQFHSAVKIYKSLLLEKDMLYGSLYDKYQFHNEYKLDSKSEIECRIFTTREYQVLQEKINTSENFVKFLERTIDNIKNMNYTIKNYVEYKKFISGN